MSTQIRLCQLNIEESKHLELVVPFVEQGHFDVVCIQELVETDIPQLEAAIGGTCFFVPMCLQAGIAQGIGIFSTLAVTKTLAQRYGGWAGEALNEWRHTEDRKAQHDLLRFSLAVCDIEKEGELFRIATTHFPVTNHGQATDFQREDVHTLLGLLAAQDELMLVGDFNAPRGGEIFALLAARYKDNVPPQYKTSLDPALHRAGKTHAHELADKMVDGIFSTPTYQVSEVQMHSGLSDHCALTATVSKQ